MSVEKKEIQLALTGNYQELRDVFFDFRKLCRIKAINHETLTIQEVELIQKLREKSFWGDMEAFEALEMLKRFRIPLERNNVKITHIPTPQVKVEMGQQIRPKAALLDSITYNAERGFVVYFEYSILKVDSIKQMIVSAKFDTATKTWSVGTGDVVSLKRFAKKWNIRIGHTAAKMMDQFENNLSQSYSAQRVELGIKLNHPYDFFDYQTVGVDFGIKMMRSWITDVMGLGKSLQAIGTALGVKKWPVLVVGPKSMRLNWKKEVEKYTDKKAVLLSKKNIHKIPHLVQMGECDFAMINYDGIKNLFCSVFEKNKDKNGKTYTKIELNGLEKMFKGIIIDESHELKNRKSDRWKIMRKVVEHMEYRQLLTGTPFVNKVEDISAQLEILGKIDDFGGHWKFCKTYAEMKKESLNEAMQKKDSISVLQELNTKLRTSCMIRREKWQVLKDLPDKFRSIIKVDITNRDEYDHAYLSLQDYLAKNGASAEKITAAIQAEIIVKMMLLKKISAKGKHEALQELLEQIHAAGEKAIVFVWHKETIQELKKTFPDLLEISGDVSDEQIERNKSYFQERKESNLIVITYKKGGVGHTLTAGNHVIFIELGWNPKDQDQAEDRAHRIGQQNTVTCHYLLGENTIDEDIYYDIIEEKREKSNASTGSEEEIETSSQKLLINKFLKKNEKVNA